MAIKCPFCGTVNEGFGACPVCKKRREDEIQRNHQKYEQSIQDHLKENENRRNEERRREDARLNEERISQLENKINFLEEDRRQQELQQRAQELEEQLNSDLREFCTYAEERNLTIFSVYYKSLEEKIRLPFNIKEFMFIDVPTHKDKIKDKILAICEKEWYKLIDYLKSEGRLFDMSKYDRCLKPTFKLSDIKQVASNDNTDYVIMEADDETNNIFPVSLASKSGYEGKKIEIEGFRYLMSLHDNEEAEKVAQILSNVTKRFSVMQKELEKLVSDTISEYTAANPKPVYKSDNFNKTGLKPLRKEKKKLDDSPGIFSRIISILPGLIAFPLVRMCCEEILDFSSNVSIIVSAITVVIAALLSAVSRIALGVVVGIFALVGTGWFLDETFDINRFLAFFIISPVVALLLGISFPNILEAIDTKIAKNKLKKEQKSIEKENKKIEEENRKIKDENMQVEKEKQREKERIRKWEQGLIDSITNLIDRYDDPK